MGDALREPTVLVAADEGGERVAAGERPAVAGSRVVTIQYLRAIAASLVVLHHAFSVPPLVQFYPRPYGSFGVDLFFVISGYIMWSTTADGSRGPRRFWTARIVRIVPLYWIFTTLYIAVALAAPSALFSGALDPIHLLKSYLFVPAVHPATGQVLPVYMLGWTLNYEMFFYLIFGLCLLIPARRRLPILVGSLALLVGIGVTAQPGGAVAEIYTNPLLLEFAGGAVLARMVGRLQAAGPAVGWSLIGAALCWLLVAYTRESLPSLIVAHGVPAIATVTGALILEPWARRRPSGLGLFLGDASYSLYLAHPFAQRAWYFAAARVIGAASSLASEAFLLVSMVAVGIAAGALTYFLVEKPILRVGRRLGHLS